MARVFRHNYTMIRNGQRQRRTCKKWYIEYTDASGKLRRVPGFTDRRATEARANELQRRVDRERAGIIDRESIDLSRELSADIGRHVDAYGVHLKGKGVSEWHHAETLRRLRVMVKGCGFGMLADVKAEPVQRWLAAQPVKEMGARTRNTYISSLRAFVRWCIADGRMAADPLVTLAKADESSDVRHQRRSLTDDELARLLEVAAARPLAEYGRETISRDDAGERPNKQSRRTWTKAPLTYAGLTAALERAREALVNRPDLIRKLERVGRERALIYKTLVLTGLRRGELAGLRWGDLELDGPQGWLTVRASTAKNGKSETLPVREDLARDLRAWRDEMGRSEALGAVFHVPDALVRILDADLKAAGIPKADEAGRIIDVHALRHTTATYLAKAGVAPRTAQSIMRHSDIRLTLGTYTDPRLLDTVAALDALPAFKSTPDPERMRANGTDGPEPIRGALGGKLGGKVRPGVQKRATACADGSSHPESSSHGKLNEEQELATVCTALPKRSPRGSNPQPSAPEADALSN